MPKKYDSTTILHNVGPMLVKINGNVSTVVQCPVCLLWVDQYDVQWYDDYQVESCNDCAKLNNNYISLPRATVYSKQLNSASGSARWLYVVLVKECQEADVPFKMPIKRIEQITRYSKHTISRGIKELTQLGFLRQERDGLENVYTIEPRWIQVDLYETPSENPPMPVSHNTKHWQTIRKKRLEHDDHRCTICGATEDLHIHHLTYDRKGNEDLTDVITLCGACHRGEHKRLRQAFSLSKPND